MANVTYPGVYIEEISSGVRTITGVATSIAAFVDYFPRGPLNRAVRIQSFADFERKFGGLDPRSEASYAIQQFFLNGGSDAYAVRVSSTTADNAAKTAAITMQDKAGAGATQVLKATAASPGLLGNNIRIEVDYGTDPANPDPLFNLRVTEVASSNGAIQVVAEEKFSNLIIDATKPNNAADVVNAGSKLVVLAALGGSGQPAQTGTVSKALKNGDLGPIVVKDVKFDVSVGAKKVTTAGIPDPPPATLPTLAATLQSLIRGAKDADNKVPWPNATVAVVGSPATKAFLVAKPGVPDSSKFFVIADNGGTVAAGLGFGEATQNVQQYVLGADDPAQAAVDPKKGTDGIWDLSDAGGIAGGLIGNEAGKKGMYALLDVDLLNILCIPATMKLPDSHAVPVAEKAIELCEKKRRAMYVLDVPEQFADDKDGVTAWLDGHGSLRSRNAAVYFPRTQIADPLRDFRPRFVAPSGTVAGVWARTDAFRGVWKAPAGTEATLAGVQQLSYKLTDPENGVLNPLGINCLRVFPIYGPVCWGARTLKGADQMADEYKYIPIRRLALFIEESLYRGTQWVVFEPNDEPLWAQIRLNIGAFMQNLFRQGAFQGKTPAEAYFVKCDKDTTIQNDINLGIVNIIVGFAPLKPAEFVVIKIQQIAGQIAT